MMPMSTSHPTDERFAFHPRATNPELWRTTLPLVVYERCGGHKGLIATWMAIHWLIVLHAAAGRRDFGVREIAARACVGRNELAGPKGYVRRLVDLGLLQIVDYRRLPGLREPRPIYHLDLWELERLSLELIPDVLRAQGVQPPPRPAPDPRQTSFLDTLDGLHEPVRVDGDGTPREGAVTLTRTGVAYGVTPENGTEGLSRNGATRGPLHESGTAPPYQHRAAAELLHENGTVAPSWKGTDCVTHENRTEGMSRFRAYRESTPETGTVTPGTVPADARNRDVEGEKDREKEPGSEIARAHVMFQELAAQAAQLVITTLRQEGVIGATPIPQEEPPPPAPAGQPVLHDSLTALWQGDGPPISRRGRQQLLLLAAELDGPTGGYGAYWVGRAILIGDRCLAERGQPLTINYLRSMLRRWQREGSWGSDLEGDGERLLAPPDRFRSRPPCPPTSRPNRHPLSARRWTSRLLPATPRYAPTSPPSAASPTRCRPGRLWMR